MKLQLDNTQLETLQQKGKLYTYMSGRLTKADFIVKPGKLIYQLKGESGYLETILDVHCDDDLIHVFSMDYSRWQTALFKFSKYQSINIDIKRSSLTFSTDENGDSATFSILAYEEFDNESTLDTYLDEAEHNIKAIGSELVVTEELLSDFELMTSLFTMQTSGNAIGLDYNSVIFADNALVLKLNLKDKINPDFFKNRNMNNEEDADQNEGCVFIHSSILRLMSFITKFNSSIWFSVDYRVIYWSDSSTRFVLTMEEPTAHLPTEEQFKDILPTGGTSTIAVPAGMLGSTLTFFDGIYESVEEWRPLRFTMESGKETSISYKSATTFMTKNLNDIIADQDTTFLISSDTLKYIVSNIRDRLANDTPICITYNNDGGSIYLTSEGIYEAVIAKLDEGI